MCSITRILHPVLILLICICPLSGQDLSGIVSDDFNSSTLNAGIWTFINPLDDAVLEMVGTHTQNARVSIFVPSNVSHSAWSNGNNAPRIMQSANDVNFKIEVKFESALYEKYQLQGIIVEQDDSNFVRFDFHSNGSDTKYFAAAIDDFAPGTTYQGIIDDGPPLYMSVERRINQWTFNYGYDGQTWTTAISFEHALTVTAVGPFIGNSSSENPAPAHTGLIDYFFNTASPIASEDGEVPTIVSTADTVAAVEQEYNYDINAIGSPEPTYHLTTSPSGMTIDTISGEISWTPGSVGAYYVDIEARNSEGTDSQDFFVNVIRVAPTITSTPVTEAFVWHAYSYDVDATAGPLPRFELTESPPGMTIDSLTGLIQWIPSTVGDFDVTIVAANLEGTDAQSFTIAASDTVRPTALVTSPVSGGTYHILPTLTIELSDDVGLDRAYFQFDVCTDEWTEIWSSNSESIDTVVVWTVPDVSEGGYAVHFRVVDDGSNVNSDTCDYFWTFTYLGGFSCCVGLTGNVDGDTEDIIDIGDLSALIDYLFITLTPPVCMGEANVDGDPSGNVDIGDLTALIDYLFITFRFPAACQ